MFVGLLLAALAFRAFGNDITYTVVSREQVDRCFANATCEMVWSEYGGYRFWSPRGVSLVLEPGGTEVEAYLISSNADVIVRCPAAGGGCAPLLGTGTAGAALDQVKDPADVIPEYAASTGVLDAYIVADTGNNRVLRCPAAGGPCAVILGTGTRGSGLGELNNPRGLALELRPDDGAVQAYVVADSGNSRVLRCPVAGSCAQVATGTIPVEYGYGGLIHPRRVAVELDPVTRVPQAYIVSDFWLHVVCRFPVGGGPCALIVGDGTSEGTSLGHVWQPEAVAIELAEDNAVAAYVIGDMVNDRVLRCPVPIGSVCADMGLPVEKPRGVFVHNVVTMAATTDTVTETATGTSSTTTHAVFVDLSARHAWDCAVMAFLVFVSSF